MIGSLLLNAAAAALPSLLGGGGKEPKLPDYQRVNIDDLIKQVEDQAYRAATTSQALEQEFDPATAALRDVYSQQLLDRTANPEIDRLISEAMNTYLTDQGGANFGDEIAVDPLVTQALQGYGEDLALGGQLPREIQNLVARAAAGQASRSGTLGTQMGRDLAARDLGLTALDIRNSRLANALNAGQVGTTLNQNINAFNSQLRQAQKQQNLQTLSFLEGLGAQNRAEAASAVSGARPTATLDPASLADIMVSDINALNQFNQQKAGIQAQQQQANSSALGGLLGQGLQNFGPQIIEGLGKQFPNIFGG